MKLLLLALAKPLAPAVAATMFFGYRSTAVLQVEQIERERQLLEEVREELDKIEEELEDNEEAAPQPAPQPEPASPQP